ncbi:MAG: ribonuclease N1 [Burkholderiales bacterium]|nr:ribonuclease N1 [Burkholderiales bacterium]
MTVAIWRHYAMVMAFVRPRLAPALAAAFLALAAGSALARGPADIGTVPLSVLPKEAKATLTLIRAGGPFPYEKDGSTFGNRERLLPPRSRGYYREYTVPTPNARDRGARRIVAGQVGEYYWTADHYRSFQRIAEDR